MSEYFEELSAGVVRIDVNYTRRGLACCYLMIENGRAAFFDTGTTHSAPILLDALSAYGISLESVDWVVPTHAHLDHAGGSGKLMELFPNARLVVHPRAAQHLIDPSKLIAGSTAVYGKKGMQLNFGEILPVPENRVDIAADGYLFELAGRELKIIDSPGHALHHFCVFDTKSRGFFAGDTFGLCYPELRTDAGSFIIPPTTPSHFDPDSWVATLDRLMTYKPVIMYTTHFGAVTEVHRLCRDLKEGIRTYARLAQEHAGDGSDRAQKLLESLWRDLFGRLVEHGCQQDQIEIEALLTMDLKLNVQGLESWLNRLAKAG